MRLSMKLEAFHLEQVFLNTFGFYYMGRLGSLVELWYDTWISYLLSETSRLKHFALSLSFSLIFV